MGGTGGEGRRWVGVKRDDRARMPEAQRTVETGSFYLTRLRERNFLLRGNGEVKGVGAIKEMAELEC